MTEAPAMNTPTIDPALLAKPKLDPADLAGITLATGDHRRRGQGLCVMEAVAWLAGREHSDAPPCVAPSIRRFLIRLNDRAPDGPRQRLKEVALDVLGTAERGDERARAYLFADWACRVVAPMALDAAKRPDEAARMRALAPVTDPAAAKAARDVGREVRQKVHAAYAAYAAAYAAAAADAAAAYAAYADAADAADAYAAYAAASAATYAAYADAADAADAYAAASDAADAAAYARERMWEELMDQAIPFIRKLAAA